MFVIDRGRDEVAARMERAATSRSSNDRLSAGIDSAKARLAKVMGLKVGEFT